MPHRPRVILPDVPMHLIRRGNNRQVCCCSDDAYRFYLGWLGEYAAKTGCSVHAYVLMTNHAHLLLSSDSTSGVGELMKFLRQRYVQCFNRT